MTNPGAVVELAPASLHFAPIDYAVDQAITITAPQDDDTIDGTTTLTLISPGIPNTTVEITVTDDDTGS